MMQKGTKKRLIVVQRAGPNVHGDFHYGLLQQLLYSHHMC